MRHKQRCWGRGAGAEVLGQRCWGRGAGGKIAQRPRVRMSATISSTAGLRCSIPQSCRRHYHHPQHHYPTTTTSTTTTQKRHWPAPVSRYHRMACSCAAAGVTLMQPRCTTPPRPTCCAARQQTRTTCCAAGCATCQAALGLTAGSPLARTATSRSGMARWGASDASTGCQHSLGAPWCGLASGLSHVGLLLC